MRVALAAISGYATGSYMGEKEIVRRGLPLRRLRTLPQGQAPSYRIRDNAALDVLAFQLPANLGKVPDIDEFATVPGRPLAVRAGHATQVADAILLRTAQYR